MPHNTTCTCNNDKWHDDERCQQTIESKMKHRSNAQSVENAQCSAQHSGWNLKSNVVLVLICLHYNPAEEGRRGRHKEIYTAHIDTFWGLLRVTRQMKVRGETSAGQFRLAVVQAHSRRCPRA